MKTIIICLLIMLSAFSLGIWLVVNHNTFEGLALIVIGTIGMSAGILAATHKEHSSKL